MSNESETSVNELLKQASDYVAATQPVIDGFRKAAADFRKQAERTVGVLVSRGVVAPDKSDDFVEKVSKDHSQALRLCERLASIIETNPELGKSASAPAETPTNLDPFVAAFASDLVGRR